MSIDAVVFRTFRKLGFDDADATVFADEINATIDKRYELHARQLTTRGDLEAAKSEIIRELSKQMMDMQRWSLGFFLPELPPWLLSSSCWVNGGGEKGTLPLSRLVL